MKTGNVQKQPNGEVQVTLTENEVDVCVTYVTDEELAASIVEGWKNGTYRLLTE